jgi:hypothetical protein
VNRKPAKTEVVRHAVTRPVSGHPRSTNATVSAATMGFLSTGDFALSETKMTDSVENVTAPWRYEGLDRPGHWLQLDAAD